MLFVLKAFQSKHVLSFKKKVDEIVWLLIYKAICTTWKYMAEDNKWNISN